MPCSKYEAWDPKSFVKQKLQNVSSIWIKLKHAKLLSGFQDLTPFSWQNHLIIDDKREKYRSTASAHLLGQSYHFEVCAIPFFCNEVFSQPLRSSPGPSPRSVSQNLKRKNPLKFCWALLAISSTFQNTKTKLSCSVQCSSWFALQIEKEKSFNPVEPPPFLSWFTASYIRDENLFNSMVSGTESSSIDFISFYVLVTLSHATKSVATSMCFIFTALVINLTYAESLFLL